MKNMIKAAGVQLQAAPEKEKNLSKAALLIDLAVQEGARIVALPQLFNTRWFAHSIDSANFSASEREDGPTVSLMRETAAKRGVVIIAPIFEEDKGGYYNTAFVLGVNGEIIGKYRKVHVPQIPLWEERAYFKPGNLGFPVFDTPFGKIGVQLCWDIFFPEGFRALALKGAEMVFAPTASAFEHSHKKWERAIAAAAHANGMYIFRVNRVGKEEKQEFYGKSFCVRPDGEFVHRPSGSSEGVVLADMDMTEVARVRNEWVFLKDRRPGEYKGLLEQNE
ncbi:MAG: acyltransferase [Deltaproteobacteria bacterium]|nr:acyltransferase [Deltaproteobacteria bacterium]